MLFDGDTFDHDGHTFQVSFPWDDCRDLPWEREDGHGPVSDWRRAGWRGYASKAPGERLLCWDHGSGRFYDFAEACRIALRDGWGFGGKSASDWMASGMSAQQVAAKAAEEDFNRLRRFCNGDWGYCGCVVSLLNADGSPMAESSLWGIETDAEEYLEEVAHELAGELLAEVLAGV